jgi:phosphoribosylanthranilate isomerase
VSSGVEIEPGVKSRERLQALFAAIRMRAEGQGA